MQARAMPRVMIVAGSDSGGGAGIQADIKTVTMLGGFATTAITALTAQNTIGVQGVMPVFPEFIISQMDSILSDIGADVIKTGMLHDSHAIEAVASVISHYPAPIPMVIDPVMVAKGGAPLLDLNGVRTMTRVLFPHATLVTPNIPEAEYLTGKTIATLDDMYHVAEMLLTLGASNVLLKGGHLKEDRVTDLLAHPQGIDVFEHERIETAHTHGTGCTLASAIATGIGQGMSLREAVERARRYVFEAIRTAPGFGHGHGPLNHGVHL